MSDSENTQPGTAEPTVQQAAQVSEATGKAVVEAQQRGASEEETRVAATEAMQKKADELGMRLHPDERDQIADTMIGKLRQMGAFDPPPAAAPAETPAEQEANAAQAAAQEPTSPNPPQKKSLAERFAGI